MYDITFFVTTWQDSYESQKQNRFSNHLMPVKPSVASANLAISEDIRDVAQLVEQRKKYAVLLLTFDNW